MIGRAVVSHYRRHPLQLLALWGILTLATALWSGVWTLTQQARDSMNEGEAQLAGRELLVRDDGQPVTVRDFAVLRRQGLCVMPWLEVAPEGRGGRVVGIDPLAMACAGGDGLARGQALDGEPFVDISEAAALAGDQQATLRFYLARNSDAPIPPGWTRRADPASLSTGELADSFLLNLNALGLLVVLVSALLIRSVYTLGLTQRQHSLTLLERYGVPRRRLRARLLMELMVLACAGVVPGYGLGLWLADGLSAGFGAAMAGLFDQALLSTRRTGTGFLVTAAMMTLVLLWCGLDLFRSGKASSSRYTGHGRPALVCLFSGAGLLVFADALVPVFAGIGLVLAGAGLLTPGLLRRLFPTSAGTPPLRLWRRRELGVLVGRLALPLVALQLAAGTVIAIHALVNTFEDTFQQWLEQRLAGDLFVEVPAGRALEPVAGLLNADDRVDGWHPVIRGRATLGPETGARGVDVMATDTSSGLIRGWSLLAGNDQSWKDVADGQVLINEQLALREGLDPGSGMSLEIGGQARTFVVAGVYADYGRPAGEVLLDTRFLPTDFHPDFRSLTIDLADRATALDGERLTGELAAAWHTPSITVRDNETVHGLANRLFDQTFALTRAISYLTLILAIVALLMTGWVVLRSRAWYFRLLSVWGLTGAERLRAVITLTLELLVAIWLVALPVGVGLTWVLVALINPLAFGWTLPMAVYPGFWLELLGLFLASSLVVGWLANGGRGTGTGPVAVPAGGQA